MLINRKETMTVASLSAHERFLQLEDAIEEIERLTSRNATLEAAHRQDGETIARQHDEIERLVAALSDLLKYIDDHDWGTIPEGETADRARAALSGYQQKTRSGE